MADEKYYDGFLEFTAGINQGIAPILLAKNQLANGLNLTVRGAFATQRPPYREITLSFTDTDVRSGFEDNTFQGACYFRPDSGAAAIMTAISGRLFKITPDAGDGAVVTEHTISGDPNPESPPQAWLWQSETFVIYQDGQTLPLFFDGLNSRRSDGPATSLGVTSANFTVPAVGYSVQITLTSTYNGAYNIPVTIGGARYQVSSGSVGNAITLRNINDTAGNPYAVGTPVNSSNYVSFVDSSSVPSAGSSFRDIVMQSPYTFNVPVNTAMKIGAKTAFFVSQSDPTHIRVTYTPGSPTVGDGIALSANVNNPTAELGTLAQAIVAPAVGGNVGILLSQAYTGSVPAAVTINNKNYLITAVGGSPTPSNQIYVVNLTDTPGATVTLGKSVLTLPELPAGRMGTYGLGRNWMAKTDGRTFLASDIVGGSSGSIAYAFRDAVLKVTENTFLNGGGNFTIPSSGETITAMKFVAELDKSLGQGPLQVLTEGTVFSCNAPVDRTTWQNITNPILSQSLISNGGLSQNATVLSNGDLLFRSIDGERSLILARREFATWGNVPISREVQTTLDADNEELLPYGSAIVFDNRLLMTASPIQGDRGVYHTKLVVLNFDPISSLRGKAESVYDGIWEGLNILQLVTGKFSGKIRAFAICANVDTGTIELHEILKSQSAEYLDDGENRVVWEMESPAMFRDQKGKTVFDLVRLQDGEIYVKDVSGTVGFETFFRPDYDTTWHDWHSWEINDTATWRPCMGLGEPTTDSDPATERPFRVGYSFQIKVRITGKCTFMGARFLAVKEPQTQFAPIIESP